MNLPLGIVLVLFIVGLSGWAAVAWARELVRRRGLSAEADARGLRFDPSDPFDLPEACYALHLFTRGHSRLAWNVVHGRADGLAVRLFDYQFETGSGWHRRTHRWQVALANGDLNWPVLLCQPGDEFDPLEELFGLDEVAFDVQPFAGRFRVACADPAFAYRFLHPRVIDLLTAAGAATVETCGPTLAVCRPGTLTPPEAGGLLDLARQLAASPPDSLRQELLVAGG